MRKIDSIILHCSATREGQDFTVEDIDRWHKHRGWSGIGYHYVIYRDGSIHKGRDVAYAGAHCRGHNSHSIGVCYIGGLDEKGKPKDTRTPAQKKALVDIVKELTTTYHGARVYGHNQFAAKACPCFDVKKEFSNYQ